MRVGIVYEVVDVVCDLCSHEWVAIIETDEIDWGNGEKEIRLIESVECPKCDNNTIIQRENN
jgi:hypothetical protein